MQDVSWPATARRGLTGLGAAGPHRVGRRSR